MGVVAAVPVGLERVHLLAFLLEPNTQSRLVLEAVVVVGRPMEALVEILCFQALPLLVAVLGQEETFLR